MDSLLTRAIIAVGIAAAGLAIYWAWNRWQLHRLVQGASAAPGLAGLRPGTAAVLYFTTTDCSVCRTVQQPALAQLEAALGDTIQIIEINATEQPSVADYWGVLSVPTTFIIDRQGQPRRVNHGLTRREKLAAQLAEYVPVAASAAASGALTVD